MKPTRKRPNAGTVRKLSSQAETAAAKVPDPLLDLAAVIKDALESEADPYVMLGVLLEGIAQTLVTRVPPERHRSTLAAALVMLRQRLADRGTAPGQQDSCHQQPSSN